MEASRLEVPPDDMALVSVESVAHMGVADLEAWLGQALDPRVPVDVLAAVFNRHQGLEEARRRGA